MARSDRRDADNRSGLGTLPRAGARPRPRQRPAEAEQDAPDQRRGRLRAVPSQYPPAGGPDAAAQRPEASARAAARPVPPQRPAGQRGAGQRAGERRRTLPRRPAQAPPAERAPGAQPGRATGPQPAAPSAATSPSAVPRAVATRAGARSRVTSNRVPFVVLLCGLLGGALVSALVISTTLAAGSFQISQLQSANSTLAKQQQSLEAQVQQAQSPQQIAQRALQLGMRRPGELRFLDLATGKTSNDGPTWSGAANAPGYAP